MANIFALSNRVERQLAVGHAGLGLGAAMNDVSYAPNVLEIFGKSAGPVEYTSFGAVQAFEAEM